MVVAYGALDEVQLCVYVLLVSRGVGGEFAYGPPGCEISPFNSPSFPLTPFLPPTIHHRLSSTGRWWRARPHTSPGASWPTTTQSECDHWFLKPRQMQLVVRAMKCSPGHFNVALVSNQLGKRAGAVNYSW